jgi:2-dehydropantoate 2-reductase
MPEDAVLCITVQNPDLEAALIQAAPLAEHTVITWQNGIRAEERAASHFPHLIGGVVRCTATVLAPGEVRLRAPGSLIVGRWPRGVDAEVASIAGDLKAAGFTVAVSPEIQADKALKLLVNVISGPAVLLERTGKEPLLALLQTRLLEEALAVFDAAGIEARPASGLGETPEALLAHFRSGGSAPDTSGGVYNSTWQNLRHRRPRLENDAYQGEIVRLGARFGVPAPVNARVLAVLEDVQRRGLGPEPFDREAFRRRFEDVVDFDKIPLLPGEDPIAPKLEI